MSNIWLWLCSNLFLCLDDGQHGRLGIPAVGSDHHLKVTRLADIFQFVVVVGEVFGGEREVHLDGFSGFDVDLPEGFKFLDRAGGGGVDVVDIQLDDTYGTSSS